MVTNNSSYHLKEISMDVAYYDHNNNIICKDSRYNDVMLNPGQSVEINSYSDVSGNKERVAHSEVVSYDYITVEDTPSGYKNIDVNLQTEEVLGSNY